MSINQHLAIGGSERDEPATSGWRFGSPEWFKGLTLSERLALAHNPPARQTGTSETQSSSRLQRWREHPALAGEGAFGRRLAMDEMSEEEFAAVVAILPDALGGVVATPGWAAALSGAYGERTAWEPFPLPEELRRQNIAFLNALVPLIRHARQRVHDAIGGSIETLRAHRPEADATEHHDRQDAGPTQDEDHRRDPAATRADLPFDPKTIEDILIANLPYRLLEIINRTMILELNVARLQGRLTGTTPQERFASFVASLCQRNVTLSILKEYPVMARQVVTTLDHWANCAIEFVQHLGSDWDTIRATFSSQADPGVLVQIGGGAGDSHRGGHSVLVAGFSSGLRIVYKPRPMSLDVHFQELLSWLNERGAEPPLRTTKIIDRGTYGWCEFVSGAGCENEERVRRFYARQGEYLALLYALHGADFHHENLIAAGEHPILVDLEAMFHPRVAAGDATQAGERAIRALSESVLDVGLLPRPTWTVAPGETIDLSGLAGKPGQLTPMAVPISEKAGTDEMHIVRKRMPMGGHNNRPSLNGADVDVLDYQDEIVAGFTSMYRLILKHRDELLSADGPLAWFAGDHIRFVARRTMDYGTLLQASYHPDALRNALDRDWLFDWLWAAVEGSPHLERLIRAERDDLLKGDVPFFSTRPDTRDLWTSTAEVIEGFFEEPAIELVRRRIASLGEDDMARQLWTIRASLATLAKDSHQAARASAPAAMEPKAAAGPEQFLAAARAVGDRLEKLAIRGEQSASWLSLETAGERQWVVALAGTNLYNGACGIAMFLAHLGAMTGQDRYADLAKAAVAPLRQQLEKLRSAPLPIGAFDGWGGMIYALAHLGTLWNEPGLVDEAESLVEAIPALIEKDEILDIIGGSAGCIGGLLALHACRPSERTLGVAVQCGERLLGKAKPMERGIGWLTTIAKAEPFGGFAHGAAGIAWALMELAAASGQDRFRAAAIDAIAYERTLFSPDEGNWRDLRTLGEADAEGRRFMTAWCYGAPGIGLSRLASLAWYDDADVRSEIDIALATTAAKGFGAGHCLCHGDVGNLELLLQASLGEDARVQRADVDRVASGILASIERNGWLCGTPRGVEVPGLMVGIAGIGYEFLRLADPGRVPSVLLLEPPKETPE